MLGHDGALAISIRHGNGAVDSVPPRDVPAGTLIHVALGGLAVGDIVTVDVRSTDVTPGGAVAYVSITDDTTNDVTVIVAPPNGLAATAVID